MTESIKTMKNVVYRTALFYILVIIALVFNITMGRTVYILILNLVVLSITLALYYNIMVIWKNLNTE